MKPTIFLIFFVFSFTALSQVEKRVHVLPLAKDCDIRCSLINHSLKTASFPTLSNKLQFNCFDVVPIDKSRTLRLAYDARLSPDFHLDTFEVQAGGSTNFNLSILEIYCDIVGYNNKENIAGILKWQIQNLSALQITCATPSIAIAIFGECDADYIPDRNFMLYYGIDVCASNRYAVVLHDKRDEGQRFVIEYGDSRKSIDISANNLEYERPSDVGYAKIPISQLISSLPEKTIEELTNAGEANLCWISNGQISNFLPLWLGNVEHFHHLRSEYQSRKYGIPREWLPFFASGLDGSIEVY